MNTRRLLLIAVLIALITAYFGFDLGRYLSLEHFKTQQAAIEEWRAARPATAALLLLD